MKNHQEILLYYLIKRMTIFLVIATLFSFGFSMIGNLQSFLDSTQVFLLNLARFLGLASTLSALSGCALNLILFFHDRRLRRFASMIRYGLAAGVGILVTVFSAFISAWTRT
jgi:hypothetical protein